MSKGRHCAGRPAGRRRATSAARKAAPGARKAPPEARRASPVRVGGAPATGRRRMAGGGGRPAALTALGSGEKVLALIPLAILSAASVAGLTTGLGDDGGAASPTATGPATGRVATPESPASARPTMAETTAPVAKVQDEPSERVEVDPAPTDTSTTEAPPVAPVERYRDGGSGQPAGPTESPAAPSDSPSETPTEPPADDGLTQLEATTQCLASGISALDVAALAECVQELLD